MRLTNKRIILTGASAGIGQELLNQLVAYQGVQIIAVARNSDKITQVAGVVYPLAADVSTAQGVDHVFAYAQSIYGDTDIFIANAGFAYLERLGAPDWGHLQKIFALNTFSPIYALEKLMAESDSPKTMVAVISGVALVALPGYSLYCSTKAALHHFANTFAYEKKPNLQFTAVYPVATRTHFFDKAASVQNTPLPFPRQNVGVVAKKIIRGIELGKKKVYPSTRFRLVYPLIRIFPWLGKIFSLFEKRKVQHLL